MTITEFLKKLTLDRDYDGQIAHVETNPARAAQYGELAEPMPGVLADALARTGVERLYSHQVDAVGAIRAGENVVVVTGTASGKTLCYDIPVIERLIENPNAKALFLYPTKALAQDQLKGLLRLAALDPELSALVRTGTYDGDTSAHTRRKLRDEANVILSNPDMLHAGILPYHPKWNEFFKDLAYVVIDEIHTYRGIFGSNVGNVIRRLRRVCEHYGSSPQFICSSATIANPQELAERMTGLPVRVVDNDGSPRGKKHFVLWNPPFLDIAKMERRSTNVEGHTLMAKLIADDFQTIAFGRARVVAELIYRYTKDTLRRTRPEYAEKIKPYRGGYLPGERREIERQLFSGGLMGVASTNALELGIDVGGLDAAVIVGFPGTIASTWQQAGRAGRGSNESVAFLVGYNDPIDQYLMRHGEYFFKQNPENAVIDPENRYILSKHLRAAASELPLTDADSELFGELTGPIMNILEELGELSDVEGKRYWATTDHPARQAGLRTISDDTYTIVDAAHQNAVIGVVDAISAPELVYPEAVYLHEGETYFVRELDTEQKIAYVEKREVDYYTQPVLESSIRIVRERKQREWAGNRVFFGDATVTWLTAAFKKIKFYQLDSIGWCNLDLPPQHLETGALWFVPDKAVMDEIRAAGKNPVEGLVGIRNIAISVLPLFSMCDRRDIGGIVDSSNTGLPTMFIYDRFEGGLGFAERGYNQIDGLLCGCLELVSECGCEDGCPSCVGLPILRPAIHQDPDAGGAWPIPDKESARLLLEAILARA
ncbi:DEAD/DEAH box helicase [bacterium]|nr:DEAD/DEAH box helicase [bacterium]